MLPMQVVRVRIGPFSLVLPLEHVVDLMSNRNLSDVPAVAGMESVLTAPKGYVSSLR